MVESPSPLPGPRLDSVFLDSLCLSLSRAEIFLCRSACVFFLSSSNIIPSPFPVPYLLFPPLGLLPVIDLLSLYEPVKNHVVVAQMNKNSPDVWK